VPERDSGGAEGRADRAPAPGRVLGLDLGQSRIGVAISDDARRVAVPFGTVHTGAPDDVKAIARIVAENGVTEIVVGLPLSLSGASGEGADHARKFAEALRGFLGISVALQDERLSTVEAERGLREAGVGGRSRRAVVDQSAAAIILQSYLDRHRR
jgi:putative Holliday junction resolvase